MSKQTVARMNDELGDLGDVAVALKRRQVTLAKPKPLTVRRVLETLRAIASEKGAGSAGRKKDRVLGLMRAAREGEIRWLRDRRAQHEDRSEQDQRAPRARVPQPRRILPKGRERVW